MSMKSSTIYSDANLVLRVVTEPVPVEPKRDYSEGTAVEFIFKIEYGKYREALQHCKDSSVPVDGQATAQLMCRKENSDGNLLWSVKPDTLYTVQEFEYKVGDGVARITPSTVPESLVEKPDFEAQSDMLREILENWKDNQAAKRVGDSYESEDFFIVAELEKFTITRKK